jgi:hypothetical protein
VQGRDTNDASSPTNYCPVEDRVSSPPFAFWLKLTIFAQVASSRNSPIEEPDKFPSRPNGDGSKKARMAATSGASASTSIDLTGDDVLPNVSNPDL